MKKILAILFIFIGSYASAQTEEHGGGTGTYTAEIQNENPGQ